MYMLLCVYINMKDKCLFCLYIANVYIYMYVCNKIYLCNGYK